MVLINNKYYIGEFVYLKTDTEQLKRLIVSIEVYPDNSYIYKLINGLDLSKHFEIEISPERDTVLAVGGDSYV